MDCHLERKIRLSEESEFKSLYSWSLQEFNEEGQKVGSNHVPWDWSLYFTASELRHHQSIEIHRSNGSDDEENNKPVEESETISAILHPGICRDGERLEDDTSYFMFGTNRRVKQFGLGIYKLEESDDKERCALWGSVSYTTEIDFRDTTTDDTVQIYLWLSPNRFNNLVEIIKAKRADIVQVHLSRVSGFYSEWSPSISTYNIKVLAASDDQEILCPDNCKIDPPRLGEVGKFNLSIIQRNCINPKQDLRGINIDKIFEEPGDFDEKDYEKGEAESRPDATPQLLAQLARNGLVLSKLNTPLWLIFIALLLLLFK